MIKLSKVFFKIGINLFKLKFIKIHVGEKYMFKMFNFQFTWRHLKSKAKSIFKTS